MIQTEQAYLDSMTKEHGDTGYIFLQTEGYGFDEYINVVVQPRGKFMSESKGAKVFENVKWLHKIYVPATDDVLI